MKKAIVYTYIAHDVKLRAVYAMTLGVYISEIRKWFSKH